MSIDWQDILVVMIVAGAAGYLLRASWRTWRGRKTGCGGACACSGKKSLPEANQNPQLIPLQNLTLRQRPLDRN